MGMKMKSVYFTADFDWCFESGCCGLAVRAFKAGWSGAVEDDVADAATAAGKASLISPQAEADGEGEI